MQIELGNDWGQILKEEMEQPYFQELVQRLDDEYEQYTIYPKKPDLFHALKLTPYKDVKVVILGQDPYHGPDQAHGLSFSVLPGITPPPSLKNIFKELEQDLGSTPPNHGCLEHWAGQGVLLLNAVLTVREGQANSHRKLGWQRFTDKIIETLNAREHPMVFILWGRNAQEKGSFIDTSRHLVIQTAHPSPLSARTGFFGSRPFSKSNQFLKKNGIEEIDWQIPSLQPAPK
ncbi:uracil-DNA glycosylase [Cohnella kolymensis]|uniref:Uracil-DNA glycosylase n=1 Tax=Cohnella kolymensis TaxID=1590652 RepID=A0ABR5A350_9BACL|nr:uracil-DNA glycosylase [Cohnella kolymensis]KIL35435.1 uracil-DNA glycosylase [Cohnella kolymensis]